MKTSHSKSLHRVLTSIAMLLMFAFTLGQAEEPTKKAVRFIYFVEKDQTYSQKDFDAIKKQAFALQKYWNEQFGGTFYLTKQVVDVVMGDHDADWYVGNKARWRRYYALREEVNRKIEGASSSRTITYPKATRNGYVGANWDGARMDGDDIACIYNRDDTNTTVTYGTSKANCLGHLAHEFGHTYGLGHVGTLYSDCMRGGLYSLNKVCDFGEENRLSIVEKTSNEGWLDASPLETVDGYKSYAYNPSTVVKMESPKADNATLTETTETFIWTKYGTDIEKYRFFVGSKKGGSEYYRSAILSSDATTATVSNLPEDGSRIYVRIKYKIEGKWYRQDYQYNALNNTSPTITSPLTEEAFSGKSETFTWEDNGVAVSKYKLLIGSKKGASDYYKSPKLLADTQSVTVSNLPTDGTKVYVKFVVVDENGNRKINHFVYVSSK